jgi:hypothetical protein
MTSTYLPTTYLIACVTYYLGATYLQHRNIYILDQKHRFAHNIIHIYGINYFILFDYS